MAILEDPTFDKFSITKDSPEIEILMKKLLEQETSKSKESGLTSPLKEPYDDLVHTGLMLLLNELPTPEGRIWQDGLSYCRSVIDTPQDDFHRANAVWVRSCTELLHFATTKYGPGIIEAAKVGNSKFISDHYNGDRMSVAHVSKKTNFQRYCQNREIGCSFYPHSSPVAVGCYESGLVPISLGTSVWLGPESAVQLSKIVLCAVCDDYGAFEMRGQDVRIRMTAMSLGAAYRFGVKAVQALLDSSAMQVLGTSDRDTVDSAIMWRAVCGGATGTPGYVSDDSQLLEQKLIGPGVMMGFHDLFDFRIDLASGNYQNGICATYGLGISPAFHCYLEALLNKCLVNPRDGIYWAAAVTYMQFTAARYGPYKYHGSHSEPCEKCVDLLRVITDRSGLAWLPKMPPGRFAEGQETRLLCKRWTDNFEEHNLIQEGTSWIQYLITTGKIWLFDALNKEVEPIDESVDWT
jgi:hypothetical protein